MRLLIGAAVSASILCRGFCKCKVGFIGTIEDKAARRHDLKYKLSQRHIKLMCCCLPYDSFAFVWRIYLEKDGTHI